MDPQSIFPWLFRASAPARNRARKRPFDYEHHPPRRIEHEHEIEPHDVGNTKGTCVRLHADVTLRLGRRFLGFARMHFAIGTECPGAGPGQKGPLSRVAGTEALAHDAAVLFRPHLPK